MKPSVIPPGGRVLGPNEVLALLEEMTRIVESSHLFKSLDQAGRTEVLESGYVASFPAGEILMHQDEPGTTMYLILKGTVRVETDGPRGRILLAELSRDACVGEVSVLSGTPRTAWVTAVTDVDVVCFEAHRIRRVLDRYPKVRALLQALVESRARDTIAKLSGE